MWHNKFVVVGVTGGIAAYKGAELVSTLVKQGAEVQVIMTASAQHFITPLTLQTLSKNPVITDMFNEPKSWEVQHIALADRADLFIIAPATANILGKVACGIADDMLSTTIMATRAPVLFAPAMNIHMYANAVVQDNISRLKKLGYHFIEPASGRLACGYEGKGRLPEVQAIMAAGAELLQGRIAVQDMAGLRVLVTAGATREALDPVRFITNHSTGKMGYAIAAQAARRGADVMLISGPATLPVPARVKLKNIQTAREMFDAVTENYSQADIVIKSAAVADYRPKQTSAQKIKKKEGDLVLELERNPDILAWLGEHKVNQVLVGFAAETNDLVANASDKVRRKNLDFIVANDLTQEGAGFGTDTNVVKFIFADGKVVDQPKMTKQEVANAILDEVLVLKAKK
ncbi:MAG TPA: bifunctional phosphopantothenoylcysteine decarboxylase/phosphopantothenate--cysteine ligase CoaBC [Bacillota bacterium]|nr:bifunctional phosphopantothenoylcysteine decarboxylase/phosphopantothenate--cysteine ligase CoaBC [Bacillota bacterium]